MFSLEEIEQEIFGDLVAEVPATGWSFDGENTGFSEWTLADFGIVWTAPAFRIIPKLKSWAELRAARY